MTNQLHTQRSHGFTLVEVMISIMVLLVISVLTASMISQSIKDKARMQRNIDEVSSIRSAMKVMERDIQMAFHYQDIGQELKDILKKKRTKKNPNVNDPPPAEDSSPSEPKPNPTAFLGSENQLHFTSLNHVRVFTNRPEGDQQEVGYFISDCRKLGQPDKSTKCLWRRNTPTLDDKVDEGGTERVLLEDLSTLSFRYLEAEADEWVTVWKSTDTGDARTADKFPDAVEITLIVDRGNDREDKLVAVIPIRHPNNKKKKEANPNSETTNPDDGSADDGADEDGGDDGGEDEDGGGN
jgi:prepilin-type N-terminal cleavage/methylation domain-containing protein